MAGLLFFLTLGYIQNFFEVLLILLNASVLGWCKCVSYADVATSAYETQLHSLTFNLFFCIVYIVIPDVKKRNEFVCIMSLILELTEALLRMVVRRDLLRRSHSVAGDCTLLDTGSWRS